MSFTYLAIDPGLRNTCISLITVGRLDPKKDPIATVHWSTTFDLSGKVNPQVESAEMALSQVKSNLAQEEEKPIMVIEFQPPLFIARNPALVRWNSWIEGYFIAGLRELDIRYAHPNGMKRKFDIVGGSHAVNKRLAIEKAKTFLPQEEAKSVKTDHFADTILMAVYQFLKDNPVTIN